MSVVADSEIRKLCLTTPPMISPFSEGVTPEGMISWGLSSCGYDIRISGKVWVLKNTYGLPIDPKRCKDPIYAKSIYDEILYEPHDQVRIPAGGYILAESLEWFNIPKHIAGRCVGKSTLARCGITINVTPLEPMWSGKLVIEIANDGPGNALVYAHEGVAQILFETIEGVVEKDYSNKHNGGASRYQGQEGITLARV